MLAPSQLASLAIALFLALLRPAELRSAVASVNLEIKGYVDVRVIGAIPQVDGRVAFTANIQDCDYLFKTESGPRTEIVARLGTNGVAIVSAPPPPPLTAESIPPGLRDILKKELEFGPSRPAPRLSVVLGASVIPRVGPHSIIPTLWFAMSSQCVITQSHKKVVRLFDMNPMRDPEVMVDFRPHPANPKLVEFASFFSDGTVHSQRMLRWHAPFDKGFTNAVYKLITTRSVNGIVVPERFSMTVFQPDFGGSNLVVLKSFEATVTNAQVVHAQIEYPNIPEGEEIAFIDKRFVGVPGMEVYHYNTNRVLSLKEVTNTPDFVGKELVKEPFKEPVKTLKPPQKPSFRIKTNAL